MITVATSMTVISVTIGNVPIEAMLDSGSMISFLWQGRMAALIVDLPSLQSPYQKLVIASKQPLKVVDCVQLSVHLKELQVCHKFLPFQN